MQRFMGRKGIVIEAPGIIQRRVLALDKFAGFSIFFEDGLSLSLSPSESRAVYGLRERYFSRGWEREPGEVQLMRYGGFLRFRI